MHINVVLLCFGLVSLHEISKHYGRKCKEIKGYCHKEENCETIIDWIKDCPEKFVCCNKKSKNKVESGCGKPPPECISPLSYTTKLHNGCSLKGELCVCQYTRPGSTLQWTALCIAHKPKLDPKGVSRGCGVPPSVCKFPFEFGGQWYQGCDSFIQPGKCVCIYKKKKESREYLVAECRDRSLVCKNGQHEAFDYSKFTPSHSAALPPRPECQIIKRNITLKEQKDILKMHNEYRSKVASGNEYRSAEPGISQPQGANIKELIWNNELAYIAQKWADQCIYSHEIYWEPMIQGKTSLCSRVYSNGQNLFWSSGDDQNSEWKLAISAWYDEVQDFPTSNVDKHQNYIASGKIIGHYTQIMWAKTYEIGCGAVYYSSGGLGILSSINMNFNKGKIYVCNYGPGGNMEDDKVYEKGRPASKCKKKRKSDLYSQLCAPKP